MIIITRIHNFLNKCQILADDAITYLTSKISYFIDKKTPALCDFIDPTKAFGTVRHNHLLNILDSIGIRGQALHLLEDYLTNTIQQVEINNIKSELKLVEYGVRQGTVLGPLLFNLYINDLFKLPLNGEVVSFADDMVIISKDENWESLKAKAEIDLQKFQISSKSAY